MFLRSLVASLLVSLTVAAAKVSAGEFVEIAGGTRTEPLRLVGYMARPQGAGPFSAVVLLHGCGGFHSSMIAWADRLSRFGYAALAVDSFGPRGIDDQCGGFNDQAEDGYAALRYLTTRPFVPKLLSGEPSALSRASAKLDCPIWKGFRDSIGRVSPAMRILPSA